MSEYIVDIYGNTVYYDLKSNTKDYDNNLWQRIRIPNETTFYVRPHREDGPAIIWYDGTESYCVLGKYHREDGPAETEPTGRKLYYINDKRHREDGPAVIHSNGDTLWCLNNIEYTFEKWCKKLDKSEEEINFLKLKWNIK